MYLPMLTSYKHWLYSIWTKYTKNISFKIIIYLHNSEKTLDKVFVNNQTTNHIHSYFRRDAPHDASQRIIEQNQHRFGSQLFSCHESSLASSIEEIIDLLFFSLAFWRSVFARTFGSRLLASTS